MALTRKFLQAMQIEDDKIDEIITAHSETVNGLKDKVAQAEEKAKGMEQLQHDHDEMKKKLAVYEAGGDDKYKEQYEQIKAEFDQYKVDVEAKELARKKDTAYRELLKEAGVSEKRYDSIMKVTDLSDIELTDDGIKDADKLVEAIKTEWGDFVVTEKQKGAKTDNPPANNGGGATMTKDEIRSIKDHQARQKAMIENASLFGLE